MIPADWEIPRATTNAMSMGLFAFCIRRPALSRQKKPRPPTYGEGVVRQIFAGGSPNLLSPRHLIPDGCAAAAKRGADERTLLPTDGSPHAGADSGRRADDDRALLNRATTVALGHHSP